MAFAVKTAINAERTSSKFHKTKTFDYDGTINDNISDINLGDPDVTFLVERDVFHGHQHIFSRFSTKLRECFGWLKNGNNFQESNISNTTGNSNSAALKKVTIDAPAAVFEAIFNFCYTRKLSVPVNLLPSVYLLAKRLCIEEIQRPCAEYLADHITIGNVGQLCQLIRFGPLKRSFELDALDDETLPSYEIRLASSLYTFVQENADTLACSLSGQLSARLIVNLTFESLSDNDKICTERLLDEELVFGVLLWAQQRIVSGQRLARSGSEENVQSDDEESDGGTSNSKSTTLERKTKQARATNLFSDRLDWLDMGTLGISALEVGATTEKYRSGKYETNDCNCKSVTNEALQSQQTTTQDVRITLSIEELPSSTTFCLQADDHNGMADSEFTQEPPRSRHPSQLLIFSPSDGSETCVLAPTSLGIGSTSIWLGKLVGHLVSLSIKRCRLNSAASTPSRRRSCAVRQRYAGNGNGGSLGQSTPHSISSESVNGSVSSSDEQCNCCDPHAPREDEEVVRTVTAETATHLARAAVTALVTSSSEDSLCGAPLNGGTLEDVWGNGYPLTSQLIEARSGAGAGCLLVDGKHHLIVTGGYTRKGCLVSVEVHTRNELYSKGTTTDNPLVPYCSLNAPIHGPRLPTPRGRLALACSYSPTADDSQNDSGILYVCGGSNGSVDLSTAERLTSAALRDWLSEQVELDTDLVPNSSLRNSVTLATGDCVHRAAVWQPIARLNQARSSPAATGLDELTTGPLVANTRGSVLVAGGLAGAAALSSVEAYVPERDQWVQLPDMCTSRYEAACAALGSKNLVVVVGGDGASFRRHHNTTTNNNALVEALDPRCSNWMSLPSFNPAGHGKLRGASLVRRPASGDGLLLIAGFNGQDTLNRTWLFDPTAWQWLPGPFLSIARTNPCAVTWSDRSATLVLGGFNGAASTSGFLDSIEIILSS